MTAHWIGTRHICLEGSGFVPRGAAVVCVDPGDAWNPPAWQAHATEEQVAAHHAAAASQAEEHAAAVERVRSALVAAGYTVSRSDPSPGLTGLDVTMPGGGGALPTGQYTESVCVRHGELARHWYTRRDGRAVLAALGV